jgi:hypothetical protein
MKREFWHFNLIAMVVLLVTDFGSSLALVAEDKPVAIASWWVKDAAIQFVGRASADKIVPHVDLLLPFLNHVEQWLQSAISFS